MKKVFIFILILISNILAMSDVSAFDVRISGARLTIHAEQIPLQDILKRMVKQGVLVRIDPTLNPLISASFENRDVQEALSSILKPVAYVLTWEADVGLPGTDPRLIEIQIFKYSGLRNQIFNRKITHTQPDVEAFAGIRKNSVGISGR